MSQDLSNLTAVAARGTVLSIALDVQFRENPSSWRELPWDHEDEPASDDLVHTDSSLLRWFESSRPRPSPLSRPWKPLRPVQFNLPKHVFTTSSVYLGDSEVRPNLALNGWNAKKSPQPKTISQSAQFLPPLADGQVIAVQVNATHIVITVKSEHSLMCSFYSRDNVRSIHGC